MSEATEILDAVTRMIQAVKSSSEDQLAKVLVPAIDYFIQSDREQRARSERSGATVRIAPDIWQLREYIEICAKLNLDPKAPDTPAVLRNLRATLI